MVVAVVVGSYALVVLPQGVDSRALPPSAVAVLLALWCTTSTTAMLRLPAQDLDRADVAATARSVAS